MRFKNLQDWLQWIESCHPSEIELGLERMGQVFQRLDCNFTQSKIITVAGTNGKGSCVAVLEHLLCEHGLSVGCYTSPHFLRYNERVRVNGKEIDDQSLVTAFDKIDQARGEIPLTYFEYGTLAALEIFSSKQLEVVILEVGLGGRLDASNIVDADVGVVTNIDIDHVDWLGSDIEVIGREKSGIFRKGSIAICGDPSPPKSVEQTANELGALFCQRDRDFNVEFGSGIFDLVAAQPDGSRKCLNQLPLVDMPFDSVVAAIQVCELLGLDQTADFYSHIQHVSLTGRFQQVKYKGRSLILDVAHNPAAAEHLANKLAATNVTGKTYALVAMMADKDAPAIVKPLCNSFDAWYVADLTANARAMKAIELQQILDEQGCKPVQVSDTIAAAVSSVIASMGDADKLIVFGSFFTVAEMLDIIDSDSNNNKKPVESI